MFYVCMSRLCIYIYMYKHMRIYIYICICIYVYVHISIYIYKYVLVHVWIESVYLVVPRGRVIMAYYPDRLWIDYPIISNVRWTGKFTCLLFEKRSHALVTWRNHTLITRITTPDHWATFLEVWLVGPPWNFRTFGSCASEPWSLAKKMRRSYRLPSIYIS